MANNPVNSLSALLEQSSDNLALIIGNGIHRYVESKRVNSWDQLLVEIAQECSPGLVEVPPGTTLTEFYDVLELLSGSKIGALQEQFCALLDGWDVLPHHRKIMNWAVRHCTPVLTTNFDQVLSDAVNAQFWRPQNPKFTSYYPWECHFSQTAITDPCASFGVWHINGMVKYKRSIRLGLSHYMGSVQRARTWLHRSGAAPLFGAKDRRIWAGANTWIHVVFNKPLLIFGLALEENEVFLRWLLIERAKYFKKFRERFHPAWYVYKNDMSDDRQAGKLFFLESMGVNCIAVQTFGEIYDNAGWSS